MFHRHQRYKKHNRKLYDVTNKSTFSFFYQQRCVYASISSIQFNDYAISLNILMFLNFR